MSYILARIGVLLAAYDALTSQIRLLEMTRDRLLRREISRHVEALKALQGFDQLEPWDRHRWAKLEEAHSPREVLECLRGLHQAGIGLDSFLKELSIAPSPTIQDALAGLGITGRNAAPFADSRTVSTETHD